MSATNIKELTIVVKTTVEILNYHKAFNSV